MPQGKRKYDDIDQVLGLPTGRKYDDIDQVLGLRPAQKPPRSFNELLDVINPGQTPPDPLSERAYDALARGFKPIAKLGRQVAGIVGPRILNPNLPTPPMAIPETQYEQQRNAELANRQQARGPGNFATQTMESVLEAAPSAALALIGTEALGGGTLAGMGVGGGLAASQADWGQPGRAALQTAVGAVAPKLGSEVASRLVGPVASKVVGPAVGRALAEIAGGGTGNVLGQSAESLALEGRLPTGREMTKQFAVGGALSAPGALAAGRGPTIDERVSYPYNAETAPTAETPEQSTSVESPSYTAQFGAPPELSTGEFPEFAVSTGKVRQPGAQGPGATPDLELSAAAAKLPEPPSLGRYLGGALTTVSSAMRTFKTMIHLTGPFNQAAIMTISHPLKAFSSFGEMLRSLSPTQSAAIDQEILNHPALPLGREFGLHISTGGAPEENFALQLLNKAPIVSHSERSYRTYLDSLRIGVWDSYVQSLQAGGRTPETDPQAYRDAAAFINIATGRGALKQGGMVDKAMGLAGVGLFAPRNLIARFQSLDPVRYAGLAPGARQLVLRDAGVAFGSMLGTALLLRQAGVQVGLDPREDNFMVARWGDHRYDLSFGARNQVQFLARMITGAYNQVTGEGNLPGQTPLDVLGHFSRGKLAPLPSLAVDYATGRDFLGQKMSDKSRGQIAMDAIGPMVIADLLQGYNAEGWTGLLKSSPAVLGAKVSVYPDRARADWLDEPEEFRTEQRRLGEPRSFLAPHRADPKDPDDRDETVDEFASRKAQADQWMQGYGRALPMSDAYRQATPDQQKAALDLLKKRVVTQSSKDETERDLTGLVPEVLMNDVKEQEQNKQERKRAIKPQKPSSPVSRLARSIELW